MSFQFDTKKGRWALKKSNDPHHKRQAAMGILIVILLSIPAVCRSSSWGDYWAQVAAMNESSRIQQQMNADRLATEMAQLQFDSMMLSTQLNMLSQIAIQEQHLKDQMLMNSLYIDYSALNNFSSYARNQMDTQLMYASYARPANFNPYPYYHAMNQVLTQRSFSSSEASNSGSTTGLSSENESSQQNEGTESNTDIGGQDFDSDEIVNAPNFLNSINLNSQLFTFNITGQLNTPNIVGVAPVTETSWLVSTFSDQGPTTFSFDLSSITTPFSPNLNTDMLASFHNPYLVAVDHDFTALVPPAPPNITVESLNPVVHVEELLEFSLSENQLGAGNSGGAFAGEGSFVLNSTGLSGATVTDQPFVFGETPVEVGGRDTGNQIVEMQDGQLFLLNPNDGTFVSLSNYLDRYWRGDSAVAANPYYLGYYFPRFDGGRGTRFWRNFNYDISLIPNIDDRVATNMANVTEIGASTDALFPVISTISGVADFRFGTAFSVATPKGVQTITNAHVVTPYAAEEGSAAGDIDTFLIQGPAAENNGNAIQVSSFVSYLSYASPYNAALGGNSSHGVSDYALLEVDPTVRSTVLTRSLKLGDQLPTVGTEVFISGFPRYNWNTLNAEYRPLVLVRARIVEILADGQMKLEPVNQNQLPIFKGMSGGPIIRADDGKTALGIFYGFGNGNFGFATSITADSQSSSGIRFGGTNTYRQPACTGIGQNC